MASIIRIKRSGTSGNPSVLGAGELAYSAQAGNQANGGDRLYVGFGTETAGDAANHYVIGGKYFTDMMDHVHGTLTASSALIVDADSKLDNLKVDNLDLNGNTISSTDTNGNIVLDPDGTGYVSITGTNGVVIPVGTTAQRGPTVQGTIRYNTDNSAFEGYSGTTWGSLGGVKSVDGLTYISAELNPGDSDDTIRAYTNGTLAFQFDTDSAQFESKLATVTIAANTASSSTTTGALVVTGGVGIGGALNVTGNISAANITGSGTISLGNISISGNTIASSNSNGDINITPNGTGKVVLTNPYVGADTLAEYIYDTVGGAITAGTGITVTNNDGSNTSTVAIDNTVVTLTGTQTLTNKTISFTSNTITATSAELATAISDETGSGSLVFANSPSLTTPTIGAATATSITGASGNLSITAASGDNNINLVPTGTGTVDVANKRITSVAEPTQATDAATKNYVDAVKTGLDPKDSVRVATTANLTATYSNGTSGVGATLTNSGTQAALTIDSIVLSVNDRILVKNQSTASINGIYTVTDIGSVSTNWVLTRATDSDTGTELTAGAFTFVEEGTLNGDNGYVVTTNGAITIGTTDIDWVQFSGAGQVIAGNGLTKTGNQIDVVGTADRITANADSIDIAATYVGQSSITTLGTITTGVWQGTIVDPTYGGTGVNNGNKTITLGGNFTHTGAHTLGLTTTANTSVTLPISGTLATLAGTETFTNKTLTSPTINSGALSGTFSGGATLSGAIVFSNSTASSSSITGAVVVTGGVGIGGNLYGAGAGTSTLDGFNIDGGTY